MANKDNKEEWLYYYDLYHMLGHWSALMVSIGLLATFLIALSYSEVSSHSFLILIPTSTIYFASLWFNYRMYSFSEHVNSKLEPEVKNRWIFPHPVSNCFAFLVSSILFIVILYLLYCN